MVLLGPVYREAAPFLEKRETNSHHPGWKMRQSSSLKRLVFIDSAEGDGRLT
jgi:hypothetical protein